MFKTISGFFLKFNKTPKKVPLAISVILGSKNLQEETLRAGKFISRKIEEIGHVPSIIDPMEYKFSFKDQSYMQYKNSPERLEKLANMIKLSDAFIVALTDEDIASPAALKNLLEYFENEYAHKPVGILTFSKEDFGGVKSALEFRGILPQLGSSTIPKILSISNICDTVDENGYALVYSYNSKASDFLHELEWYAYAIKDEKKSSGEPV